MRLQTKAIFSVLFIHSLASIAMSPQELLENKKTNSEHRRTLRARRLQTLDLYDQKNINPAERWQEITQNAQSVRDFLVCPLTGKPLIEPVIAADGYTYEKRALEDWLSRGMLISPISGEPLQPVKIGLGIPPIEDGGPWRKEPSEKWVYYVDDIALFYVILLYRFNQTPHDEKEFFPGYYEGQFLRRPVVIFPEGKTYDMDIIGQIFQENNLSRRLVRNPHYNDSLKDIFNEFITIEYRESPTTKERIEWKQIIVHRTMIAILEMIKSNIKARALESAEARALNISKRPRTHKPWRACRSCYF